MWLRAVFAAGAQADDDDARQGAAQLEVADVTAAYLGIVRALPTRCSSKPPSDLAAFGIDPNKAVG